MSSFAALITTTWSPTSTFGAQIGLCLPRSSVATSVATRPRRWPSASTTSQARSMSDGLGVKVRTGVLLARSLSHGDRTADGIGFEPGRTARNATDHGTRAGPRPAIGGYPRARDLHRSRPRAGAAARGRRGAGPRRPAGLPARPHRGHGPAEPGRGLRGPHP